MEKQFLPFNDYLGLSSIFTLPQKEELQPEDQANKVTKAVSDAWIDKRIEEILHQYSLKRSLQNSGISQWKQTPSFSNQSGANVFTFNSNHSEKFSASSMLSDVDYNCNNTIYAGSLTNSPLTPNSGSWLASAVAATSASSPFVTTSTQQTTANHLDSTSLVNMENKLLDTCQAGAKTLAYSVSTESPPFSVASSNQRMNRRNNLGCSFCRNNKEVDGWVMSHQLKDSLNRVMCPILRSYVCPLCFASGDNAHTLGHCPLNPDKKNSSLPLAVRRRTNATGKVKM